VLLGRLANLDSNKDDHELFIIDRNGKPERLTHFSDQAPKEYFRDLASSSDSQYVAFWVWDSRKYLEELVIWDMSSGELINTFIGGDLTGDIHLELLFGHLMEGI